MPKKPAPIRDTMWPESAYRALDAGIRFAVRVLHASGFGKISLRVRIQA